MKIDTLNAIKYFVFILFLIYFAQGVFFPSGMFFAKAILAVLLVFEVWFFIKTINHWKKPIVNGFVLMVLLNILYFLFSEKDIIVSNNILGFGLFSYNTWSYIKVIFFTLSFFFIVYYLSYRNRISEKELRIFFYIYFIYAVVGYFSSAALIMDETGRDEFTNNAGFAFVHLLPFLFLIKRRSIALVFLFISLAFIIMAAKRGAIVTAFVFIVYYFYQEYIKGAGKYFVRNLIIMLLLIFAASFFVLYLFESNEYLQRRLERTLEGDSSGRDVIYLYIWDTWSSPHSSILNYLFGFGFAATIKMSGMFAHNDWLELLAMAGLLGVIIYFIFFVQIYRFTKRNSLSSQNKKIITSILIIWFLKTLFSMGYMDTGTMSLIILLAFIVGNSNKNNTLCLK